jgi:hypothetical protein
MANEQKVTNELSKEVLAYLESHHFGKTHPETGEIISEIVFDPSIVKAKAEKMKDGPEKKALLAEAEVQAKMLEHMSRATVRLDITSSGEIGADWDNKKKVARLYDKKSESERKAKKDAEITLKTRFDDGCKHTYIPPPFYVDVKKLLSDKASHVLWFAGSTGTGKTVMIDHLCKPGEVREEGMVKFQLNCHHGMGPESFFGERTIVLDPKTEHTGHPQSVIVFKEGIVTRAMQQGLDENGNEIPDAPAGLLFIDEAGAMPTHIAISLNRLLESDSPVRKITLEHDGGREIKSHSKFRVVLAANTNGRGASSTLDATYTAQGDALDGSLLNRIAATFRFGYARDIENHIIKQKLGEASVGGDIMKFRDTIRQCMKESNSVLTTPFSTRHIVKICDLVRLFGSIEKAIYLVVFEQLTSDERIKYNELSNAALGKDILAAVTSKDNVDYL